MNLTFMSINSVMHFYGFYSIIVLLSVIISACHSAVEISPNVVGYRLPNNTSPESYDIQIVTNIDKNDFIYSGTVAIRVRVLETTSNITLHARQLNITSVKLESESKNDVKLHQFAYDETTEFLTIPTTSQLEIGKIYSLTVQYTGELRSDLFGFYRSSYVDLAGNTKWLAATQFEPTDARHAFPCFDEPGFKSRFTIHIEHGETYNAISNMKETRSQPVNGRVITSFQETPPISPYLIAFIVSDYTFTRFNATFENNTTQRVFANADSVDQTSYALIEGTRILKAMENTLQVPFSLSKLDHASITYTVVGAMENWGLITYPENILLFDPTIHTEYRQMTVTVAMTHEMSHQWFGNLVSPKWWSYLWLNEGFATLFKYFTADLIHPKWDIFHHFIVSEVQQALHIDAQSDSRPMTHYVESPEGIESLFDDISYSKAGSVIRMFMHSLGEKTFMKALHYYLTNNSYGIADEDTLFRSLDSAIKEDRVLPDELNITDLFGSWSHQKGFPLLNITRNYNDGSVALHQERYDAVYKSNGIDSSTWWIPYNFASASNPEFNVTAPIGWLSQNQRNIVIKPNQGDITWTNNDWLIFNRQQTGYYRVLYDQQNYKLINQELIDGDINKIHAINRAQILDDLHEFVGSNIMLPDILCETLFLLENETSYVVWETAKRIFTEWNERLQACEKYNNFKDLVAYLAQSNYEKWGINEHEREEPFDNMSRDTAVYLACTFGLSGCLQDTYTKFKDILNSQINGTDNIWQESHNIRGLVIAHGIRSASTSEIEHLWQIFLNSTKKDGRMEILSSFANIGDISIVELYLNRSFEELDSKKISVFECQMLVTSIIKSGQTGVSLAMEFFLRNLTNINTKIHSIRNVFQLISERVLTSKMESLFHDLLKNAHEIGLISKQEVTVFAEMANEKVRWQLNNLEAFQSKFFSGKCIQVSLGKASGATKSVTYYFVFLVFIILIILCTIFSPSG